MRPSRGWLETAPNPSSISSFEFSHQAFEFPPAMLVIFELIETRAGRREQHGIAADRPRARFLTGSVESAAGDHANLAAQLRADLFSRRSNEQRGVRFFLQRRGQRRVVAVLVLASENDPEGAWKRRDSFQSRVDIGCFRIVVPGDAVALADEFQAMFDPGEGHDRGANLRVGRTGE